MRDLYSFIVLNKDGGGKPKLRLQLHEEVHPSLGEVAKKLELMVLYFDRAINDLFKMHGADLQLQEIDVARLAKISMYLYSMISTIARANRSYCDGHRHNDMEVQMCASYITVMEPTVMHLIDFCRETEFSKIDPFITGISMHNVGQGRYASVHPLTKNMF